MNLMSLDYTKRRAFGAMEKFLGVEMKGITVIYEGYYGKNSRGKWANHTPADW